MNMENMEMNMENTQSMRKTLVVKGEGGARGSLNRKVTGAVWGMWGGADEGRGVSL